MTDGSMQGGAAHPGFESAMQVFQAVAGFGDFCTDIPDDVVSDYLVDASSPTDIERWFTGVIYPAYVAQFGVNFGHLINFCDIAGAGHDVEFLRYVGSMTTTCMCLLAGNEATFMHQLSDLIRVKLRDDYDRALPVGRAGTGCGDD